MTLWALDRGNWVRTGKRNYVHAFFISVTLALISETIQNFTPDRSFQLEDIVNDLIGAGVFLLLAYQYKRGLPKRAQAALRIIALVLMCTAALPMLAATLDELHARRDFPLLGSFETRMEMERWEIEEGHERIAMHATNGKRSLRVDLSPGLYPGITLSYPCRDWRGYYTLSYDVFLDGTTFLPLSVRINDLAHNEEYDDRYIGTFSLRPGPNRITISLAEVEHAPRGRKMDMGRISILCIFSYKLKEPRTVYFDNFRLEGRR